MSEENMDDSYGRLKKAVDKGRQLIEDEDFKKKVDEIKSTAEEVIRKRPIAAVLIGLGIGYIIGKILSSNDD